MVVDQPKIQSMSVALLPVPFYQLEVDVSRGDKSIRQPDFVTGRSILFQSFAYSDNSFPALVNRWKVHFKKNIFSSISDCT